MVDVHAGDPRYRDQQLRGYNRRFVGTPDSVVVASTTDDVVMAVDAAVAADNRLAVRSGGHCMEGFVDDPAVRCVIDLGQMDSVAYDPRRRAFVADAGATLGRVYRALDMRWGATLPGGIGTRYGRPRDQRRLPQLARSGSPRHAMEPIRGPVVRAVLRRELRKPPAGEARLRPPRCLPPRPFGRAGPGPALTPRDMTRRDAATPIPDRALPQSRQPERRSR